MNSRFLRYATPRIHLFYVAIFLKIAASALSAIGFVLHSAAAMVSGTIVWLAFFTILMIIAIPEADHLLQNSLCYLRTAAFTIVTIFLIVGVALLIVATYFGLGSFFSNNNEGKLSQLLTSFDKVFGYNDATALSHQATENLLDGKNPYAESNIVSAMIQYDVSIDKITPLRKGRFADDFPYPETSELEQFWQDVKENPGQVPPELESNFNYPAGCFLLPAPFIMMGVDDFRIIYLILLLPVLVYVILKVQRNLRLLLIIALLTSLELWNSLAAGETDFLYFPFLFLAWILYKRNLWWSALFMAAAVAIKQLAWFFLPFYLIIIYRTMGYKKVLTVTTIIAVVFLAANMPFIIMDPDLWFTSVIAPVRENMFPLGVGIITLVTGGILDIHSPLIFSILEFSIAAITIIWYFFYCTRYPDTGLVLAVLPLFFAWRSLWGYFFYIDIILLASIMINEYGRNSTEQSGLAPVLPGKERVVSN